MRHQLVCISPFIAFNVVCVSGVVAVDLGSPIFLLYIWCMLLLSCSIAISIAAPLRSPLFGVPLPASALMNAFVAIQLMHTGLLAQHTLADPTKEKRISLHVNQFYMFTACNLGALWGTLPCPDWQRWGFLWALATCACSEAFRHAHLLGGSPVLWVLRGPASLAACAVATHGIALAAVRHSLKREQAMGDLRVALDELGDVPVTHLFDAAAIARSWAAGPLVRINVCSMAIALLLVLCDAASREASIGPELVVKGLLLFLFLFVMWPALLPCSIGRHHAAICRYVYVVMPAVLSIRIAMSPQGIQLAFAEAGSAPGAGPGPPAPTPGGSTAPGVLGFVELSPRNLAWSTQPLIELMRGFCVSTLPISQRWRRFTLALLMLSTLLLEVRREILAWSGAVTAAAVAQLLQGPVMMLLATAIVRA